MFSEEWLKQVERTFSLFSMSDEEKIRYATYLFRGDAAVWWQLVEQTHPVERMSWVQFRELFETKYKSPIMVYSRTQEFSSLIQRDLTVTEYATRFSALARIAPSMVSTPQLRMDRFVYGLNREIAVTVMSGGQPPQTYSEVLDRALRAEVFVRPQGIQRPPSPVTTVPLAAVPLSAVPVAGSRPSSQTISREGAEGSSSRDPKGKRKFQGRSRRAGQTRRSRGSEVPQCPRCGKHHR